MANELRFDGKVVIITGAGNGLGRSHALLFGSRGAKVVVNDLGGGHTGGGKSSAAADKVVEEIKALGGEAVANYDSVEDGAKIVQSALDHFKRVDVVINNAGILRDVSFAKMTEEDWDLIYRVHVLGAFRVTHAAWPHLRDQGYGRVIVTASAAGIYGNFGQANYSLAKLGLVGFAQTLALEGAKKNVHVNAIAPIAGSRMTETILPKELIDALKPEYVTPLVAWLCHEDCSENGGLYEVGGGFFGKLRWERTKGKTFRVGRSITPETLKQSWDDVVSFEKADHPANVNESMAPILTNVQAGPSRGGNEFIDVDLALGAELPPVESSYNERDVAIYALGVGATGKDPLDSKELQLVYELHGDGFHALPTFGVAPALSAFLSLAKEGKQGPGLNYGFDRVLHSEQYTEIKRPLPTHAKLVHKGRIKDIFDKGKAALVVTEIKSYDENGEELIVNELTTFVRGAGGFGGPRGTSSEANTPPERAPDAVVTEKVPENQALLYRLSGDWNPLHADPNFAKAFGFDRPILHGLCTFGYVGRHVIRAFAPGGDPRYFRSIKVRFAESVFPGETLVTEMWKGEVSEADRAKGIAQKIIFHCKVQERDKVVISRAAIELFEQIPQPLPKAKPAPAASAEAPAAASSSAAPTSADVFTGISKHIEKNPELAAKVKTVFRFVLTNPASSWTLDLKNGAGAVAAGTEGNADCTLELADLDFMDMCTGKADPQKLYFGGKLKISGNVMASQKLEFLKKLDPNLVLDAARARAGGGSAPAQASNGAAPAAAPAEAAPAAAAPPAKPSEAAGIFDKLNALIAKNRSLVDEVGAVLQFQIQEPGGAWVVDLKNGAGAVKSGTDASATTTLTLTDADLVALVKGTEQAPSLFQRGRLRVDGDLRAAQKLGFLKQLG
ncbi:SDR family NAD(P)-dependent oxidoreductase [Pendulispora albinea]|uniref:SDR family NAD(P)-dependent oxidoreductase n=1 Tax=Pendulispora albinea TaxID=2741071 RepID=A0ABZ2M1F2_9BACT